MGMDIHLHLVKYDEKSNKFKEVVLLRERNVHEKYTYDENGQKHEITDPYIRASIFEGRNSEMFEGMRNGDEIDGFGYFPTGPIKYNSLEENLAEEIKQKAEHSNYFDFCEINLAELKSYLLEHDMVVDYDGEADWDNGEKAYKKNPIWCLYDNATKYLYFADWIDWGFKPVSDYKLIIYFDW